MPLLRQWLVRLGRELRRNIALRVISLLLAIGLWMFVNAGQKGALTTLQVPLVYRTLPAGLIITNHHPDFVRIQVSGPRTLLSLLDPERLSVRLDLTGVQPGETSLKITPSMFAVPHQTAVTRISPSQVTLLIDRIVTRAVPVNAVLQGTVAEGYTVASVDVAPATVEVSGPQHFVAALRRVDTAPLDVNGVSASVSAALSLVKLHHHARLAVHRVMVKATVSEVIADKRFNDLQVQVRDSDYRVRVRPDHLSVTVRGPMLKLAALDLTGQVFVEAKGVAPGWHNMPVEVNLPDGMTVVHQQPMKVRLRVYVQKRRSGN